MPRIPTSSLGARPCALAPSRISGVAGRRGVSE
jgi:hypothetical protein